MFSSLSWQVAGSVYLLQTLFQRRQSQHLNQFCVSLDCTGWVEVARKMAAPSSVKFRHLGLSARLLNGTWLRTLQLDCR